jgi:RNA-directed DNA polymerase
MLVTPPALEDPVVSRSHLAALAVRAAKGKRRSRDVARFLVDVDREADALAREIRERTYQPGKGRAFRIQDPKPRCIFALPFRDRVAQHLLIDVTLPAIERSLAPQTFACRTGMGTHRCLRRAVELSLAKEHVLRVDVTRFFPSIDHAILRRLLDRTTPPAWRWLRNRFLDAPSAVERVAYHFPGDDLFTPHTRPHGIPIGSLTSQIWANVYLAPVDHLIASHLGIGTFVRYCDDVLVFDSDPARLRDALARIRARAEQLRLRLHPTKTRLHRTTDPVSFLGFVLQRRGGGVSVRLRRENVVRMRARMQATTVLYAAGAVGPDEVASRLLAWMAHARHGQTRALIAAELGRLSWTREGGER